MTMTISGSILAGGLNMRFNGIIKANIDINGKTIVSRIIETINDIFDEIIIVTNTPEEFEEYSACRIVKDHFVKVGPLGGIHSALKASSGEAVFVFAGDMPLLSRELINKQIELYNIDKSDVLIPSINQNIEPLHAVYNTSVITALEEYLTGNHNYSVRDFYKLLDARYMQLEDSEENKNAFVNINSPSDIVTVRKILQQ